MRLVDADKLEGEAICLYSYGGARYIPLDALKRAPTVEQRQWIPVTERLPEKAGEYIVFVCPHMTKSVALYDPEMKGERKYWYDSNGFCVGDKASVTHWMPLPEPPKEE